MIPRESVGALGGTFDPVHLGHLHVAAAARHAFGFRRVLLIPCARPPHKPDRALSPAEHRLAMLRLSAEGRAGIEVSTVEMDRGGVSYTVDTLRSLASGPASVAPVFLLGSDALLDLPSWRDWTALVREFDLAAVSRRDLALEPLRPRLPPEIEARLVPVPSGERVGDRLGGAPAGTGGRIFFLSLPAVDVSSSRVRGHAATGRPLDGLVPAEVARYIRSRRLYLQEGSP